MRRISGSVILRWSEFATMMWDVVDPVVAQQLEHHFEGGLACVRGHHRRQRQADIVERDGHFHAGLELRVQRVAAERVVDGVADGASGVRQALDGRLGVNNPSADREVLLPEVFPEMNQAWRRVGVDLHRARVELTSQDWHLCRIQKTRISVERAVIPPTAGSRSANRAAGPSSGAARPDWSPSGARPRRASADRSCCRRKRNTRSRTGLPSR